MVKLKHITSQQWADFITSETEAANYLVRFHQNDKNAREVLSETTRKADFEPIYEFLNLENMRAFLMSTDARLEVKSNNIDLVWNLVKGECRRLNKKFGH